MAEPTIKKKIIIAPLDWGLGHATRCIPIIRACLEKGHRVHLISSGRSLELLKKEFPSLAWTDLPAYNIYYQKKGSFVIKIMSQFGKIFAGIRREHKALESFLKENPFDIIISDNRYGLWNKKLKNILITHQIMMKVPRFKFAEFFVHQWLLIQHRHFQDIWIPDLAGEPNLSGDLSHQYPLAPNVHFIGILTRFSKPVVIPPKEFDILVIISGPEPQRSIFENLVIEQIKSTQLSCAIVRGISENPGNSRIGNNILLIGHLPAAELFQLVMKSDVIISRGGYSTLMDLALLNKRCIFIPTPGQTEQEYLVDELSKKGLVFGVSQKDFNLQHALEESKKSMGLYMNVDPMQFMEELDKQLSG